MSILIIDDDGVSRALLKQVLQRSGYPDVVGATTAAEGWKTLETLASPIDVVFLDIVLPDQNGFDFCRRLKTDERFRDIPIIMVTVLGGGDDLQAAFEAGASDYIVKPIQAAAVVARLKSALDIKRQADWRRHREQELLRTTQELEQANLRLQSLLPLDSLTEIPNRRAFDRFLDRCWRSAARRQNSMALLVVDIDNFKLFNRTHGRPRGDDCLKRVAASLNHSVHRPMDFVARSGGEEFIILLDETDMRGALIVAETIRSRIATLEQEGQDVTVSVGVATTLPTPQHLPEHLLAAAHEALSQAKAAGRNCVKAAPSVESQAAAGRAPDPHRV